MECELDRITVHYEVFGEGRPILMLHGMPLDHNAMIYEMEKYFANRPGWRRIYLDMPGHGGSPGADWITSTDQVLQVVEEFIDKEIREERFVVAGTSYGAYVGRGVVYHRERGVDGLFLNVPVIPSDHTKRTLPPRTVLLKDQRILDAAKAEDISWFEGMAVVQNQTVLDYARAIEKSQADAKFLDKVKFGFSFDADRLPEPFPAPTLFIMGRQDHVVGYRDAWGILENYPRATFAVLDRGGHLTLGEQANLCSALVNDWLNRVEEWVTQPHL
jgi:pimeloyl-ACP methyl ester carboxylesterase